MVGISERKVKSVGRTRDVDVEDLVLVGALELPRKKETHATPIGSERIDCLYRKDRK